MTQPQNPNRKTYWLTFRLNDTPPNDKTYAARLARLNEAVRTSAVETWWTESTSFFVFFSEKTIDQLAAVVKAAIDPKMDIALIGMTQLQDARLVGQPKREADLLKLIPFVKKA